MIDDNKLLCAFLLGAYESGSCAVSMQEDEKGAAIKSFEDYISGEIELPIDNVSGVIEKIKDTKSETYRDYFYSNHIGRIVKETKESANQDFYDALKGNNILTAKVMQCPVHFYEVIDVHHGSFIVYNPLSKKNITFNISKGLDSPLKGDIISAHWNQYLEVVTDLPKLQSYKDKLANYLNDIKNNIKDNI